MWPEPYWPRGLYGDTQETWRDHRRLEFVGGRHDGEVIVVDRPGEPIRLPIPPSTSYLHLASSEIPPTDQFSEEIYHPRTWIGSPAAQPARKMVEQGYNRWLTDPV